MLAENLSKNWLAGFILEDANLLASENHSLCRRPWNFSGL
jgi:hypothetical protein